MSVFVTGDTHGSFDRLYLHKMDLEDKYGFDMNCSIDNSIMIICGDFGGVWHVKKNEKYFKQELEVLDDLSASMPYKIVFVAGNHENYDRLYSDEFEDVDFHGADAKKIRDNIYMIKRGEVFEFDGKKFWCFGGAASHDIDDGIIDPNDFVDDEDMINYIRTWDPFGFKRYRIKGLSWWDLEMPTDEEYENGLKNLEKHNFEVDYLITHCCDTLIQSHMSNEYKYDKLTNYLLDIKTITDFTRHYFGHYHNNKYFNPNSELLYGSIRQIV